MYQAKSIIANAQRAINIYGEKNPPDSPVEMTHYPTPGTNLLIAGQSSNPVRCTYRASQGDFYEVVGAVVYYIAPNFNSTVIGTIGAGTTPVSMIDNGIAIIIVDGTPNGYAIDLTTRVFAPITDPSFYGADRADYLDTFFILNRPGTQQFYISLSNADFDMLTGEHGITSGIIDNPGASYTDGTYTNVSFLGGTGTGAATTVTISGGAVTDITTPFTTLGQQYVIGDNLTVPASSVGGTGSGFIFTVTAVTGTSFDPLDIASKTSYPDPLQTLIVMNRQIWLLGQLTSEIWYNSGATDFTFAQTPGVFVQHGCVAKYSVAAQDLSIYWLSQDLQGRIIVLRGNAYLALRISTHAIENEFDTYGVVSDAIGFTYQQEGHVFYCLCFPSANKTWCFDQATELWHQRAWTDNNGILNRHRMNCVANVYGKNVVGDWENGNLYEFSENTYTDVGQPITRIRGFPHMEHEGNRISHRSFTADMAVGADTNAGNPQVSLRWSDSRGATWSNNIEQSLGATGEYLTSVQWNRLGMARDRIYELSWSAPVNTALNGAWIDTAEAGS
jgi:hypothetical protein